MSFPEVELGEARLDRFHDGAFSLYQPVERGFRAGLDAMLLAATVGSDAQGRAADLGAGTGAVGFAAASRARGLSVTLVEMAPQVASLLRASVVHPSNSSLAGRLDVDEVDLLAGKAERERAGLLDGRFDLVLTNPPFHPSDHRTSPDAIRRAALSTASPSFLREWLRAGAALVAPRGRLVLIARPEDLPDIVAALERRLGAVSVLPVHTREGPAKRILVGARKGSRAGLSILPGLFLGQDESCSNELGNAIADGRHHLDLFASAR